MAVADGALRDASRDVQQEDQEAEDRVSEPAAGLGIGKCERCAAPLAPLTAWGVSYFNTDTCCMACLADEKQAPGYEAARAAEAEAVSAGNLNFPGVGLSHAAAAFLASRRAAR
jgi:hypothetical protein